VPNQQPRPSSHFRLNLNGHESVGVFRECSGLDSETEVIEHKSVDNKGLPFIRKVPGASKWSNITLKRGVDEQLNLWQWRNTVIQQGPDQARVDGTIELIDYDGSTIATYSFLQGWPIKYAGSSLNASTNEVAIEELHICHEGLQRQ
jgi:phage tail-like protein